MRIKIITQIKISTPFLTLEETDEGLLRVDCGNSVGVLVKDIKQDKFLMVEQYRVGPNKKTLEMVCGKIDEGETPAEAASREVYEETGVVLPKSLVHITEYYPSPGILSEKMSLFLAKTDLSGVEDGELFESGREKTVVRLCDFATAMRFVADSATKIALLNYKLCWEQRP